MEPEIGKIYQDSCFVMQILDIRGGRIYCQYLGSPKYKYDFEKRWWTGCSWELNPPLAFHEEASKVCEDCLKFCKQQCHNAAPQDELVLTVLKNR